ncbi:MAG: urease accessory protein UreD [Pseudomonadales bacterium]|jgi:urease accessory protein|nr:urease accessory protein UreD [Pseudomonadales bacterium]
MNQIPAATATPAMQRSRGALRIGVGAGDVLADLFQDGALRARLPRPRPGAGLEAVVINTSGGMTGGDVYGIEIDLAGGARATVVGQACEKVYRSAAGDAALDVRLRIGAGGSLLWLPQPAILFDAAAFVRRLDVELAPGARLLAVEATVLGRSAMGERVTRCRLREHWRVRQAGRLAWASAGRLDLPGAAVASAATLAGSTAFATFVCADEEPELALAAFRVVAERVRGRLAASRLDDLVVATLVARTSRHLMDDLAAVVGAVSGTGVPRVWHC